MNSPTLDMPDTLLKTLRARGLGQGRTRRLVNAHSAIVRVTLADGRWMQATEMVRGIGEHAEMVRTFTVDPGPGAEEMRAVALEAGWEV